MSRPLLARSLLPTGWAVIALMTAVAINVGGPAGGGPVSAGPTTTIPATALPTTAATPPTTAPASAVGATTTVPTTIPGPTPRASRRVPTAVATEKIRATSLPLRTMGITLGVAIVALAAVGFVYGRVRSRIPAVAIPQAATPATTPGHGESTGGPGATPLPPPPATPLPPPVIEDAVSDTVIFEPPPTHHPPSVIAETSAEEK